MKSLYAPPPNEVQTNGVKPSTVCVVPVKSACVLPCGRRVRSLFLPLVLVILCLSARMPCAAQNPPATTASIANGKPSVTVPFVPALATSGWIPIEVRINGKGPYTFVLDTGAVRSFVVRDVAVALDLPTAGNYKFTSASKAKITTELRAVKTVDIGAVTLNNLTMPVVDFPPTFTLQGILGADFLAQFVVTVNYQRQRVTLSSARQVRVQR